MGQKLALQVVIFVQFLYVARSTYMLTIVKTNDHEIKGGDYVVFASCLEKVHLVVARTQNITFKRLICCAIAYVVPSLSKYEVAKPKSMRVTLPVS